MRAVAEWFSLRLAAAAQGDRRLISRQFEGVAQMIDNRDGPFDYQRAVLATTDP
jgi:hypothetical protein